MSYFKIQANIWIQNDFLWLFFLYNFAHNHFKEFHIMKRVNDIVFWNQIWSVFQAVLYLEIYLVLQMSWIYHWNWTFPSKPDTASQEARVGWSVLLGGTIFLLPFTGKLHGNKRAGAVLFLSGLEKLSQIGCATQVIGFCLGFAFTKKSLQELCNFVSPKVFEKVQK